MQVLLSGLDEIDQRIIDLLLDNARMSYVDIGHEVGLSRVAVKARIQSLEKQGIIDKYVTIINPAKLDNTTSVFFSLEIEPRHIHEVIRLLQDNPSFTQVYQMTGSSKLHAHAIISDDEELEKLINEEVYRFPGLVTMSCDTILTRVKDRKGMRL